MTRHNKLKTPCLIHGILWIPVIQAYIQCVLLFSLFFSVNTLRPRQTGRHFPDDIFKWIFLNENIWISINISLKFVPRGPINIIITLVQVMAWRRPGDKPLSETMMVRLPTHVCVTRPQWVKTDNDSAMWNEIRRWFFLSQSVSVQYDFFYS